MFAVDHLRRNKRQSLTIDLQPVQQSCNIRCQLSLRWQCCIVSADHFDVHVHCLQLWGRHWCTIEMIMASFSRPWKPSTELISTADMLSALTSFI